jgi:hypothetical protein
MHTIKRLINKLFSPKYLLFTNIFTGMTFHSNGDLIAQKIENWEKCDKKFDYKRLCELS